MSAKPPPADLSGLFLRPDADADEVAFEWGETKSGNYRDAFHAALYRVNTAFGGYVEERDRNGSVIRSHRARPDQIRGNAKRTVSP